MMKKDQLKMENKSNSPLYDWLSSCYFLQSIELKISNTNRCQFIQKDEYLSPCAACCIRIKNDEEKKNLTTLNIVIIYMPGDQITWSTIKAYILSSVYIFWNKEKDNMKKRDE